MKKCCSGESRYKIKYDAGLESSDWLLCESHYNSDPVFRKHIKSIVEIEE